VLTVVGCIPPELWWGDRRVRWRVIVFILVLACFGWLIEGLDYELFEAIGAVLLIGIVAGVVVDHVVNGSQRLATLVTGLLLPGRA
jgi:hypothetical protein